MMAKLRMCWRSVMRRFFRSGLEHRAHPALAQRQLPPSSVELVRNRTGENIVYAMSPRVAHAVVKAVNRREPISAGPADPPPEKLLKPSSGFGGRDVAGFARFLVSFPWHPGSSG